MTTVVMTGATSGIGRVAAEHMLQTPDVQLWRDSAAMVGLPDDPLPGPHS